MTSNIPLDNNWTAMYILLDKSASMASLQPENTAKQVNDLVHEQQNGRVTVTAATFSNKYNIVKKNVNGPDFTITAEDIHPEGCTALQESLCRLIDDAGHELEKMKDVRPGRVIVIVLTDGQENASTGEYSGQSGQKILSEKIKHQQEVYNWIFYFLGTNIDAITTGKSYGIDTRTCINYASSKEGCTAVLKSASSALNRARNNNFNNREESLNQCAFTLEERNRSNTYI